MKRACTGVQDNLFGSFSDIENIATASASPAVSRIMLAVFVLFISIILLNLLIAIISESYARIQADKEFEMLRNKAELIVEVTHHHPLCHHRYSHGVNNIM
jgi:flagellar biosynthesis protein FliR